MILNVPNCIVTKKCDNRTLFEKQTDLCGQSYHYYKFLSPMRQLQPQRLSVCLFLTNNISQ